MSQKEITVFRNLLLINQLRGEDSTGVARVIKKGLKIDLLRGLGESSKFLQAKVSGEFLDVANQPILLLGHCRAATIGSVSAQNIHPFAFSNIVGVMNGTFRGEFDNYLKYPTDTEAIYYNMNESIEKEGSVIPGLQRSMVYDPQFALAFINKKDRTLNFIKNDKRPLHFTYISARKALVWSSTSEHLEFITQTVMDLDTSGWKTSDKDPVWTLHDHNLYTIKIGSAPTTGIITDQKLEPKKYTAPKVSTYTNPMSQYYSDMGYAEGDWSEYMDDTSGSSNKELIKCIDGQYRTQEAEAKRLGSTFRPPNSGVGMDAGNGKGLAGKENAATASGSERDNTKNGGKGRGADDYSTLSWLKDLEEADKREEASRKTRAEIAKRYKATVLAEAGDQSDRKPKSIHELKFRLKQGCMCCGRVFQYNQPEHVLKIKWWNRECWACGDCYDNPETDWVKYSIDGTWDDYKPAGVPAGVQVH